jgi:hypothetical protein
VLRLGWTFNRARRDFHLTRGVALLEAAQAEFRAAANPATVDETEADA